MARDGATKTPATGTPAKTPKGDTSKDNTPVKSTAAAKTSKKKSVSFGNDDATLTPNQSSPAVSSARKTSILKIAKQTEGRNSSDIGIDEYSSSGHIAESNNASPHKVIQGGDNPSTGPIGENGRSDENPSIKTTVTPSTSPSQSDIKGKSQDHCRFTPYSPERATHEKHQAKARFHQRSRWREDFVKAEKVYLTSPSLELQGYLLRVAPGEDRKQARTQSLEQPQHPVCLSVDTLAGNEECKAGTYMQWTTIINEASESCSSDRESRLPLIHRCNNAPLPDGRGYIKMPLSTQGGSEHKDEKKKEKMLLDRINQPSREELLRLVLSKPRRGSSPIKNAIRQSADRISTPIKLRNSRILTPGHNALRPRGLDFSYLNSAAVEETLNDSELVRGLGYVPVNRRYEAEKLVEPKPWALPEFACRDLQVDVIHFVTSEKAVDETKKRKLLWNGSYGQRVLIVNADDTSTVSSFHLQNLKIIKYAMLNETHYLLFTYTADGSSDKDITIVLEICAAKGEFAVLKKCCYSAKVSTEQECDMETVPYFMNKRTEIQTIHHPVQPLPLPPQMEHMTPKKRKSHSNAKVPVPLASSPANSNFESRNSPRTSSTRLIDDEDPGDRGAVISSDESKNGIPPTLPKPSIKKRRFKPVVTVPGTKMDAVFYDTNEDTDIPIRVCVGDRVVRVHKKDGAYTDHDGPWRVLRIGQVIQAILIVESNDGNVSRDSANDEAARSRYDEVSWKQMLTTKVELNFPTGSRAKGWVSVSKLSPMINMSNVANVEVFASGVSVQSMDEFEALTKRVSGARQNPQIGFNGSPMAMDEKVEDLCCFKISPSLYLATITVQPYLEGVEGVFEIQKLSAKRLRLFKGDEEQLVTEENDPWVKRLQKHHPELLAGNVVVAEYYAHWAGWPVEDNEWIIAQNNIQDSTFVDHFNTNTDLLRSLALDVHVDPKELVYEEEVKVKPKPKKKVPPSRGVAQKAASKKSKASHDDDDDDDDDDDVVVVDHGGKNGSSASSRNRRVSAKRPINILSSDEDKPLPKRVRESTGSVSRSASGKRSSKAVKVEKHSSKATLFDYEDVDQALLDGLVDD